MLNGTKIDFGELDDMASVREKLSTAAPSRNKPNQTQPAVPQTTNVFRGTVVIDGKEITFNSKEELDAALNELFEPLKRLGIESFGKNRDPRKRLESILKLNIGSFPGLRKRALPAKKSELGNDEKAKNPFLPDKKTNESDEETKLDNPFVPKDQAVRGGSLS